MIIRSVRPRLHVPMNCQRDGKTVWQAPHKFGRGAVGVDGRMHYVCKHCKADCSRQATSEER